MPKVDLLKNNRNLLTLWSKLILLIGLPLVILILPYNLVFEGPTVCIFKNIAGYDCFGCGMTRGIYYFLKGDIIEATRYNWRVLLVCPLLIMLWLKQFRYTWKNMLIQK